KLSFCQITGSIPNVISNLASLVLLELVGNLISGSLPADISCLTRLQILHLEFNHISGPIDSVCNLVQLKRLILIRNQFNGSIPQELGNLRQLNSLNIEQNRFNGSIPSSIGNLALNHLALSANQLSGSIPDSLSRLQEVTYMYLHNNRLSGSIPASLASLQNLDTLFFSINKLSGSIPASLGDLLLLKYLSFSFNQVSGTIPTAFGKLTNLLHLSFTGNQMYGAVPSVLSNLSKLRSFNLQDNGFSGQVDHIVQPMKSIERLTLDHNLFTGRVPSPASSSILEYKMNNNFFTHGDAKFNCSAAAWSADLNCLPTGLLICGRVPSSRSPAACAAFCGLVAGSTAPVCGGRGYCSVNEFTGRGECVCDPNYLLDSTNTNACVPGAVGGSLASASAYVSLQGSAAVLSNGSILLTGGAPNQQGAAFASPALRLFYFPNKRSLCGIELAFTAAFSFAMRPVGQSVGGEGLAFVVAAAGSGKGASVGLGGVGKRSVAVEFDSVLSVKHSDPNDNHVGVNVGGSPVSLASATAPLILNDAHTKHAWIHYDPTSGGTLRVFLSSDPRQPFGPFLTASVSLCSVLKPTASDSLFLFGFVALSGSQPQRHIILTWQFTTE
ncbi:unnamed protein product, partial [Closterium sp. NIES-65]